MSSETKILLITGELAEGLVKKYASKSSAKTEVKVLPVSVASFIGPKLLEREIEKIDIERYSMILVPGLAQLDLDEVESKLEIPIFKGPKYSADIPPVLENLEEFELSKEKPACELLNRSFSERVEDQLKMSEEEAIGSLGKPYNFAVGRGNAKIYAGTDFPLRVVAEIIDAPLRSDDEIVEIAGKYVSEGAEILDIGMTAGESMPHEIPRIISILRKNFDLPLSVDTIDKDEISEAIKHGADLIVSINGSTIDEFQDLELPAVIVPTDPERSYYPRNPSEKLKYLDNLLEKSRELGYERPIADPILNPVGRDFVESLMTFYELKKCNPEVPIFMGVGNVIELYDADSIGLTALLVGAASEIGASFILTVEGSDKTRGNVSEVSKANDMMTLAGRRNSVPKDLGLDLLILKEKRRLFDPYDEEIERDAEVVKASPREGLHYDSRGFFKIFVHESEIVAVLYSVGNPELIIKGKDAEEICNEIVDRGLVSELSHAVYLGRELQKAEDALRTGRGYVQGKEFF